MRCTAILIASALFIAACTDLPDDAELTPAALGEVGSLSGDLAAIQAILDNNGIGGDPRGYATTGMIDGNERVTGVNLSAAVPPVRTLPPEIGALTCVSTLNLDDNLIEMLPAELCDMALLRELRCSRNVLRRLPVDIYRLESLEALFLADNAFRTLPTQIGALNPSLRDLRLADNQIADLPPEITELQNLQSIAISGNRLCAIGTALRDWLNEKDQSGWESAQLCGRVDVNQFGIPDTLIPGWTPRDQGGHGAFRVLDTAALRVEGLLGGPSDPYLEGGVVELSMQFLTRSGGAIADVVVMDVVAKHRATTLYETLAPTASVAIGSYPATVARFDEGNSVDGGIAFAHFDKFYIEVRLGGYVVSDERFADADMFIVALERMVRGDG